MNLFKYVFHRKFTIFTEILHNRSRKNTAISDFADLPRREQFYIASSGIKIVTKRDAIMQVKNFAVGFPNGNIHRVAAVKHSASSRDMY